MARLEYFLVAESISVDADTNRISLFHVIEEVSLLTIPSFLKPVVAVATLNREDSDTGEMVATVKVSGQGIVLSQPPGIRFPTQYERIRLIFHLKPLRIEQAGKITFEIFVNEKYLASHEIHVLNGATPSPEETPPATPAAPPSDAA